MTLDPGKRAWAPSTQAQGNILACAKGSVNKIRTGGCDTGASDLCKQQPLRAWSTGTDHRNDPEDRLVLAVLIARNQIRACGRDIAPHRPAQLLGRLQRVEHHVELLELCCAR